MTENNQTNEDPIGTWSEEYRELLNCPPVEDEILTALDNRPARLNMNIEMGKSPFVYATAFVPDVIGCELGWKIRSVTDLSSYGWKVVLGNRSRQEVIRRYGLRMKVVPIKSIRITGESHSKFSLFGEVQEYLTDDDFKLVAMDIERR